MQFEITSSFAENVLQQLLAALLLANCALALARIRFLLKFNIDRLGENLKGL